jgi:hypothetical protein
MERKDIKIKKYKDLIAQSQMMKLKKTLRKNQKQPMLT